MQNPLRLALTLAACVVASRGPARAHAVAPLSIDLRSSVTGPTTDFIYVDDGFGCPANITARSMDPSLVEVYALDMVSGAVLPGNGTLAAVANRVDQVFLVRTSALVAAPATTMVEICWVGTDPANGCDEDNCGVGFPTYVTVDVLPLSLSTAGRLSSGIVKDPIAAETGELVLAESPDLSLGGPLPVGFQRWYGSHLAADDVGPGVLGPNWAHAFEWGFAVRGNSIELVTPTGRVLRFETSFFTPGTWTLAGRRDVPYELQQQGSDWLLFDPFDQRIRRFDSSGRLIEVRDSNDNTLTLSYTLGRLDQVTDGLGRTLTFAYTGGNRLASVTDGTRTVGFTYDGGGRLETVTDATGETTTYAYDPAFASEARMTSKTLPRGNVRFVQTFDGTGRIQTQTDSNGNATTLAYAPSSGDTTVTDATGEVAVLGHGMPGMLSTATDEGGQSSSAQYDALGRRIGATDRTGRSTSWTYHASGRVERITEPDGRQTTFGWSARTKGGFEHWDLTSITRADGSTEAFTVDGNGNVIARTDANGGTWSWTYDALGNVLTATNPKGAVTTLTYNADGTLATSTDDDGNVTSYAYDGLRRLQTVTLPDTSTLQYGYDAADRLTSSTNEAGDTATLTYGENGNLTAIQGFDGETWQYAYDAMDRLVGVTDPTGGTLGATYDALGRAATMTDGAGNTLQYAYDAVGRPTRVTDDLGNEWSRTFDGEGRLTSRTNPLGRSATVAVDALGRPTSLTSPRGLTVGLAYDALGRPTRFTDASGNTTTLARGFGERVQSITIPGASTGYQYDELGNVVQVTDPGGNVWTQGFDDRGRRISRSDPLGNTTTYQYDTRGRISGIGLPGGLGSATLTYTPTGKLVQRAYTDGTVVDLTRDELGNVVGGTGLAFARDGAGRLTATNGITVGRDAAGRITSLTYAPGRTVTYTYDERNLLATVTDWLGGTTTFTHDAASRLVSIAWPNGLTTAYAYDEDDRLVRVHDVGPGGTLADAQLTRDANGNIVQAARTLPVESEPALGSSTYAYDAASRTVDRTDELGTATRFGYDALGRRTDDGARTTTWDLASRLTSVTRAGTTTTYAYDALGHVVQRTEGGQTDDWVVNHALALASTAIVRRGGNDVRYYVTTPAGTVLYAVEAMGGERHVHHFDEAGNLVFLSDDLGQVTDAFHFTPFGVLLARTGAFPTLYTFGGRHGVVDEGGGLFRMRARVYDAATGRFLTPDPIEDVGPRGTSPYPYAYGNPLTWIDPEGLTPVPGDVSAQQVQLEARFLSIEDNFLEELGVDYGWAGDRPAPAFDPDGPPVSGAAAYSTPPSGLGDRALRALELALGAGAGAPAISNPVPFVGNGAAADLGSPSLGEALARFTTVEVTGRPSRRNGVQLVPRPRISVHGYRAVIALDPDADVLVGAEQVLPGNYSSQLRKLRDFYLPRTRALEALSLPELVGRNLDTTVFVPDEGTLLVGGLRLRERSTTRGRVPILAKVPGIGVLFRNETRDQAGRILVIALRASMVVSEEK